MTRSLVLLALLFTGFSQPTFAKKQKSARSKQQRIELKAWKKRKAALRPLQLKSLVEENEALKRQIKEMWTAQETLKEMVKFKTKLLAQKEAQRKQATESARKSAAKAQEHMTRTIEPNGPSKYEWAIDENGQYYIKGIIFTVQIGAYKHRDLQHLLKGEGVEEKQESFMQEQSGDLNRYMLMHFRDYWQADQFKKELRAMGVKDAFIVALQDGKRVPLKAVVAKIIEQKK
ncbi:MAG: SPOR domain-containing protein [Bacteroidota bacterium]